MPHHQPRRQALHQRQPPVQVDAAKVTSVATLDQKTVFVMDDDDALRRQQRPLSAQGSKSPKYSITDFGFFGNSKQPPGG